ncbi:hypothetical protein ACUXAV_004647 [Cupriavidus metallidurans]|nr:type II toxin-antitoxin system MqsA family antitoxin [Cupriavidus metallidurans]
MQGLRESGGRSHPIRLLKLLDRHPNLFDETRAI